MNTNTSSSRKVLLQDLGIFLFIMCVLAGALITALAGKDLLYQHVALMMCMLGIALLVVLRAQTAGTVLTAVSLMVFTVYKLYSRIALHTPIELTAYAWPMILLGVLGGTNMFISLYASIEGINGVLNRRIDELTVMDPLTGLENMRSLVNSLRRYMAFSERNGTDMGLMIIRLRYAEEIRKVLSRQQFNDLRTMLANVIQNALRVEDRVFSMDDAGSMGIIFFSAEAGASIVKQRLINAVAGKDMLPGLVGQKLAVELSVVWKMYRPELAKDAMRMISEVENEFAYEV